MTELLLGGLIEDGCVCVGGGGIAEESLMLISHSNKVRK